ncbi:hypothetical protein HMF8227_02368 [Saliniradius amylolyticus]|uniref:HicB-like antitoxin of toxin-antitoxin system domain-containing protein n=1 Tax=Saliniradius amylolyticus TaxID=2183582 RepID=A0A2S2E6E4_9ALTE|nr:type II toxin-antitoxin system HicB family antitoxin [Saliniradius amylolyticus]AWL12820.1 hypothetical protein HMF8227_02368 [Saliniradius amylolyticus]
MKFEVGIEQPEYEGEAYGIIVPAFEQLGYGCFSAADHKDQIESQAKLAIQEMLETVEADGGDTDQLAQGEPIDKSLYADFSDWIILEV